jgi:type IV pilus assembly protein PilN
MILINLLPHREAARKKQKDQFFTQLALAAMLGGIIVGVVFTWYQGQISDQQYRNNYLQQEIAKLDEEIKDIAGLQKEIASLRARQTAVEDLQADRNLPVHLLDELVAQLPDGIYLSTMKQEGQNVLLTGVAQSQERVSELLRNLANQSPWLTRPELIEIVAATLPLNNREQRRVSNFTVRVALKRPVSKDASGTTVPTSGTPASGKV